MATTELGKSLDAMWAEARQEFKEKTKPPVDIGRQSGVLAGDLMKKLESEYAPPDEHPNKTKAIRVMNDVMKLVQLMGGLAAQVASTVFSPAGMCFNAVSFLIDGVKGMKKFHSDLASLFDSIKSFLVHFKMLQRVEGKFQDIELQNLPGELIMTTNKLMRSFVKICLLAHKSMTRGKFKSAMVDLRVAFADDDGGVRAELTNFKNLIDEQDSIKGTITLEEVMKSRGDIRDVQATSTKTYDGVVEINKEFNMKNQKDAEDKRIRDIAKKLGIHSSKDQELPPSWRKQSDAYEELRRTRVTSTGSWLGKDQRYLDWQSLVTPVNPVLCLLGRKDTGKTFVASRVIDDFTTEADTDTRAAIAYYFFGDREDRRNGTDDASAVDGPRAIAEALKCIAYQFARSNPKYAQELHGSEAWKEPTDLNRMPLEKVLDVLRLSSPRTTTFVMLFDGLDQISGAEGFIRHLSTLNGTSILSPTANGPEKDRTVPTQSRLYSPRYIVTVNPEECDFDTIKQRMEILHFCDRDSIAMKDDEPRNVTDLEQFIEEKIQAEGSALAPRAKDMASLFARFKEKLLEISDGTYSIISNRIGIVNQQIEDGLQTTDDLESAMLSDETDDLDLRAKRDIDNLETNLSARNIAQINDIIVWCLYAHGPDMDLIMVDAVAALNKDTATIQKFSQKVRDERLYRKLFKMFARGHETCLRVQDHIDQWLRRSEATEYGAPLGETESSRPTISMTITINQAEPKAVRRFLWDLHEKLAYDKSFFSLSGSEIQARGKIAVHRTKATERIVNQCLDLLIDDEDSETSVLKLYAFQYLPSHLSTLCEILYDSPGVPETIVLPEMNSIIAKLATFLGNDHILPLMKQLCERNNSPFLAWHGNILHLRALNAFTHPHRLRDLRSEQKGPLRALVKKCEGTAGSLYNFTCQMGHAWLMDESWVPSDDFDSAFNAAYEWVEEFLTAREAWQSQEQLEGSDEASSKSSEADRIDVENKGAPEVGSVEHGIDNTTPATPPASEHLSDAVELVTTRRSPPPPPPPPPPAYPADSAAPNSRMNSFGLPLGASSPIAVGGFGEESAPPPPPPPELPSVRERILQAAQWVQENLNLNDRDEIFLERLGLTLYFHDCDEDAFNVLTTALSVSKKPARIHRQLARVLRWQDKFPEATVEAELALKACEALDPEERVKEVREVNLVLARIHQRAEKLPEAISTYKSLVVADPFDYQSNHDLLDACYDSKQADTATEIIDRLANTRRQNDITSAEESCLAEFFSYVIDELGVPDFIVYQAHSIQRLDEISTGLDQSRRILETKFGSDGRKLDPILAKLYLAQGLAHALSDRSEEGFRKAYDSWMSSLTINNDQYWVAYQAASAAASYQYAQLLKANSPEPYIRKLKELVDLADSRRIGRVLTQAYCFTDQLDLARGVMRIYVENALELLSDDDLDNDWMGYEGLVNPLMAIGDTANALAAYSLIQPLPSAVSRPISPDANGMPITGDTSAEPPKEDQADSNPASAMTAHEDADPSALTADQDVGALPGGLPASIGVAKPSGPLSIRCDGECQSKWTLPDDFWECRVCNDVFFCLPCLQKLKNDKLSQWVCHKTHSWVHVPAWSQEERDRVPKGSVCVPRLADPSQPEEWTTEGGEIIEVAQWMTRIKESWGIL